VSGIIIGGFGFGAMLFDFVSTAIVNPENVEEVDERFPPYISDRVPGMLRKLGICYTVIILISALLLFKRKMPKDPNRITNIVHSLDYELAHNEFTNDTSYPQNSNSCRQDGEINRDTDNKPMDGNI